MKAILWTLIGFLLWTGAMTGSAAEKFDDGDTIIHFFANMLDGYSGTVTAVEREAGGTAKVRIQSNRQYRNSSAPFDRKVSKEFVLPWSQTGQPVPFVPGIRLEFAATNDGQVTATRYSAMLPYYRKRADSTLEVLLHVEAGKGGEKAWVRAIPDRLNLMNTVEVGWSRQHGLVISMFEAGDGGSEGEALGARDKGLPVGNVPGERILIGRDGWKKAPDLSHERSKTVVPPKQFISAGG